MNQKARSVIAADMNSKVLLAAFSLICFGSTLISIKADQWILPTKKKYYSANKKYYLEVTPKKLESQLKYFEEKVDNKSAAKREKGSPENYAKGTFYVRRSNGGYERKISFRLVNEVSPVEALVSDNGDYLVTFDNWHSAGYGDDVIVIYRSDGSLIRKFSLEDLLTDGDIGVLMRTVSSIWWGGKHEIDEHAGLLTLKIVANRTSSGDEGSRIRELKIDLATGRPLEANKDLFANLQIVGTVQAEVPASAQPTSPGELKCSSSGEKSEPDQATRIPSDVLLAKVKQRVTPPYPLMAMVARAEGVVVVEVFISSAGAVTCARALSGHPLLKPVAVATTLNWKFEPFEESRGQTNTMGTVAFTFKLSTKADIQTQNK